MKGAFVLFLAGVSLQAVLVAGWGKTWDIGSHKKPDHDRGHHHGVGGNDWYKHGPKVDGGRRPNDRELLKNFKVLIPGFYMPGLSINGFVSDGWFPDYGVSNGITGFVVGHTKFKPSTAFVSFQQRNDVPGFQVNGRFVPLKNMYSIFEYYIYNRIQDRLKIQGLPRVRLIYTNGVPPFYVDNIEIDGFAKDGLFPAFRITKKKQAEFQIDGKFISVKKFPAIKIMRHGAKFKLNGRIVAYEDLKLRLDEYFRTGGTIEKLKLDGFTVTKRKVRGKIPGFTIKGLEIPGFVISGHFPPIKYEGREPGFIISGQFVPGSEFEAFRIEGGVPGLIVNGKWYPYDANLKKYLLSLAPKFDKLEIPGFTIKVIGGETEVTTVSTTPRAPIVEPGFLGFVIINGVPGFHLEGKFVPGWKIPGFQVSGDRSGFVINGFFWPMSQIEKEMPSFELPSLSIPELTYPSYTIKMIKDQGSITGIEYKGFFIPTVDIPNFSIEKHQPGLIIENKFVPLTQIIHKYPGLVYELPRKDGVQRYPDLIFPGITDEGGKKVIKIGDKTIPLNLIPGYVLAGDQPSIQINNELVPIFQISIRYPNFQLTIPAAEWPKVTILGFEIRGGVPGFKIDNSWYPAEEIRGFQIRRNIPGFVIKGKHVPLDKLPKEFKLPQFIPKFIIRDKIEGLILKGRFIPGKDIPGFTVEFGVPGFKIDGRFYSLKNLPEEFVIPTPKPPVEEERPIYIVLSGIPGLIIKGEFHPIEKFPTFTIRFNVPGFIIDGIFVPLKEVDPKKVPEPTERKPDRLIPVYVLRGSTPGVIVLGGFIPAEYLPGWAIKKNIPGFTVNGNWTPLDKIPLDFKWPDPEPQTYLRIVIRASTSTPGVILHGRFVPLTEIPGYILKDKIHGIVLNGRFYPLTDLDEDNIPRKVIGVIRFTVENGVQGVEINGVFYPGTKINGFTIYRNQPGITWNDKFYPLIEVIQGKHPNIEITIVDQEPRPQFPTYIVKGGVHGLLINGEFIDGDYIKDFYMIDIDVDGIDDPVFYIDGKYIPIKEVPIKYPNYQVVILDRRKSELVPKFEVIDGIPGLWLNKKFINGKWITDFVVEKEEPGFKIDGKFIPLHQLPFEKPGYIIKVVRPPVEVTYTPTVYEGQFGFIINGVFYPATKIPGVTFTGEWPQIEVPVVIPGYPGQKPKFTIKNWIPGFIVKGDKFIPLKDVPGVIFIGTNLVILSSGGQPTVIPIFTKENKPPTIEFNFGFPGIDLTINGGIKVTEPPHRDEATTTPVPERRVPDFVTVDEIPGLLLDGVFVPGTSILNFHVENNVPGFYIRGVFVPLNSLPDGYTIEIRSADFPKFVVRNNVPGLVIFRKFYPHTWIKDMKVKDNKPYFTIKGKDVPLNEVPDSYKFQINIPKNISELIVPAFHYGELGFIVNNLFYPARKIPGLVFKGDWPKVEVPGLRIPGREKETPVFTIVDYVPGFQFKDGTFYPAITVPGVTIDGFSITLPGVTIPLVIKFPDIEFVEGYPGITLDIPTEDAKPVPTTTTTQKPVDPLVPDGWPRFERRGATYGLIVNRKFVPAERIHRFRVKDNKPFFIFEGVLIPYKDVPKKKPDFTLTILPENWPRFEIQNKIPGLILNGRFVNGKYIEDFVVEKDVPGFKIEGKFISLDDLIDKAPDYVIHFTTKPLKTTVTIYDGEIGIILDGIYYPGSKIPGIKPAGPWPKIPIPGLKIPGFTDVVPIFTVVNWKPGFIVPPNRFIPATQVPGVVIDGMTIILPGVSTPAIQFPTIEFTLGFPGVHVDVDGGGIPVIEFTTPKPTTTTRDPNAPFPSPPGFPVFVFVNGIPGLMISDQFVPGSRIKHFKMTGKIPGFVIDGTWYPYDELPKHTEFKITIFPPNYPEYVIKDKRPGLIVDGKFWPAEWIKDFVVPRSDEEVPGFEINGLFIPLIDLFERVPGYTIQITPPEVHVEYTIINGEIGFVIENKFYPGRSIPGLTLSGKWPQVKVPGFKIPGHEDEVPEFTIKDWVPGFIVKPDRFIPAKNIPGVRFPGGLTITLPGAHLPSITFPGFEFTLGIPGITLLDVIGIEMKPTEPPPTGYEFVVINNVPGLRLLGEFYPGILIDGFTMLANVPGFLISGEFVPLKDVHYKYPDYTIRIIKPKDPYVIHPELAIIDGVIGVIVNDIFYPGNKIPGIEVDKWPRVEIPGLKIKGHEDETPILTVKDFVLGFIVKPDKFIPITEVPQVKIRGTTIIIEGVTTPSIQFPEIIFKLGIPGIDFKLDVGKPLPRPTSPPITEAKLPEFKVINLVPGLVIYDKFIPGVFIKDFTVINGVPGFIIKEKFVPLKNIPKEAPDFTFTIHLEFKPKLAFQNGIIGFEINRVFVPGNLIPGLTIEGKWPAIELPGVVILGHKDVTPIFTIRDWVPGFLIKDEFIPATQIPGFSVLNNVIVIPGFNGIISLPGIDFTGILSLLRPRTTPAPITVTASTHFLGFDIVNGEPGFKIDGVWIPAIRIPNFNVRNNIPGFNIRGRFYSLLQIETEFPGFRIIVKGDEIQVHIPDITTTPSGLVIVSVKADPTTPPPGKETTTVRRVPTTVKVHTTTDKGGRHVVDWTVFGKIVYNIAWKWERIRETFSDVCNMAKPVSLDIVVKKKLIDQNALNKIRFFNEPFGHFLDALVTEDLPKLVTDLEVCGTCVRQPVTEFIDRFTAQFCVDIRKQPLLPFLPEGIAPALRTAIQSDPAFAITSGVDFSLDLPITADEKAAVAKVKREAAFHARNSLFWRK